MPLLLVILFVFIILESTLFSMPLTLLFLICLAVTRKQGSVLFLAFFAGILLDMLLLRTIGLSSAFFVSIVFLVMLYRRKFEIASYYFVCIAAFIASLCYLLIFQLPDAMLQATGSSILAILFFSVMVRFSPKVEESPFNLS